MARTVTALFDSRAEADTARRRLASEIKTRSTRIIAKDTAAAVDSLQLDPKQGQAYRDAIRQGCHLLVADIEAGQDPQRVVTLLERSIGAVDEPAAPVAEAAAFGVMTRVDEPVESTSPTTEQLADEAARKEEPPGAAQPAPETIEEARSPQVEEELRIDRRQVSRGGARVRSVIRDVPAEEQIALREERIDVEHRPSERRLSIEDVQAGGLLRERVFEIREMREEPVITKEAFVREEVIIRKTVRQRTETISDTVRRTDVEVDEFPARDATRRAAPRRGFVGGKADRK